MSGIFNSAERARSRALTGGPLEGDAWLTWLDLLYAASHLGWDLSARTLYRRSVGADKPRLYEAELLEYLEFLKGSPGAVDT